MLRVGRRFVSVSEQKNQSEAELRYLLTRLRENGESIALIQGEEEERAGVHRALGKVLLSWRRSEEHTSELQSLRHLVCRLLLEKKKSLDRLRERITSNTGRVAARFEWKDG